MVFNSIYPCPKELKDVDQRRTTKKKDSCYFFELLRLGRSQKGNKNLFFATRLEISIYRTYVEAP